MKLLDKVLAVNAVVNFALYPLQEALLINVIIVGGVWWLTQENN